MGSSHRLRREEGGRRVFRSSGYGAEIVYPSSPANTLDYGIRVFPLVKSEIDQQCEFINFSVGYCAFRMLAQIRYVSGYRLCCSANNREECKMINSIKAISYIRET